MNLSRRDFVVGAASWGALGGCRMFRADSNFRAGDAPRLRFGVVSDVHQDLAHLQRALEYFRSRNVDAVLSSGDWTDCGLISELENIATVWNRVFPANRAPDGHVVEKLFFHFTGGDSVGVFEDPIRKGGFTVVYMCDYTEISDIILWQCLFLHHK